MSEEVIQTPEEKLAELTMRLGELETKVKVFADEEMLLTNEDQKSLLVEIAALKEFAAGS